MILSFEFRLRNKFEFDYPDDVMSVYCTIRECKGDRVEINDIKVDMSLSSFINFCKVCIMWKQGDNKDIDLAKYGIRFERETFDDRYFYYNGFRITVGEVYFMYEFLTRKMTPRQMALYQLDDLYIFINNLGFIFICDLTMLTVVYLRYEAFQFVDFTVDEKHSNNKVGFNKDVPIGCIQSARLEKGACHPYVCISYRDMSMALSLDYWRKLKELCKWVLLFN